MIIPKNFKCHFKIYFESFIYLLFGCPGSSLLHGLFCSCGGGDTLVAVHGLLIAVAFLVVACGLWGAGHQ